MDFQVRVYHLTMSQVWLQIEIYLLLNIAAGRLRLINDCDRCRPSLESVFDYLCYSFATGYHNRVYSADITCCTHVHKYYSSGCKLYTAESVGQRKSFRLKLKILSETVYIAQIIFVKYAAYLCGFNSQCWPAK